MFGVENPLGIGIIIGIILALVILLRVTTPTSFLNRLTGSEAWTDPVTVPVLEPAVVVPPASTTLTITQALHAGRVVQCAPTGGLAITLPAPTGTGNTYTFAVTATVTGGNLTIDAKAGDASALFSGQAVQNKTGTGVTSTATAANTNLITLNGSTQGGIVGDIIELTDAATHVWNMYFNGQFTGTFASPFSNH